MALLQNHKYYLWQAPPTLWQLPWLDLILLHYYHSFQKPHSMHLFAFFMAGATYIIMAMAVAM
jgi:hypothetical protein